LVHRLVFGLKSDGATHQMIGLSGRIQGRPIARQGRNSRNPLLNCSLVIVNAAKTMHRIGAPTKPTVAGASGHQG
jgi:hypothetical protein